MRARGLKRVPATNVDKRVGVAPHAGAWIETCYGWTQSGIPKVAPHAGAWIETGFARTVLGQALGRAPCGRVD